MLFNLIGIDKYLRINGKKYLKLYKLEIIIVKRIIIISIVLVILF
uniref:Uncharacterized protein n=1 Tax=Bostrychia moritziana TaxID=103713 RepID=A0A1Z1M688_BOSMO|nr:hypothetical protein [Bostrychia moritziana]ARW61608.1 hypothetical protein [Bostrychia moritziana]